MWWGPVLNGGAETQATPVGGAYSRGYIFSLMWAVALYAWHFPTLEG